MNKNALFLTLLILSPLLFSAECAPRFTNKLVEVQVSTQNEIYLIQNIHEGETVDLTQGVSLKVNSINAIASCNEQCAPGYTGKNATLTVTDSRTGEGMTRTLTENEFVQTPWSILLAVYRIHTFADCTLICLDGTFAGECSAQKPLYCSDGTLVDKATICNCPPGFAAHLDECIQLYCSDGTALGACSPIKPFYCDVATGRLAEKASKCGCPGKYAVSGENCIAPNCTDGTPYATCSSSKPLYCNPSTGLLEENSSICGCPPHYTATGLSCTLYSCDDGTRLNSCSGTQPLFCLNGTLTNRSSICGCPPNYVLESDTCLPPSCADGTFYSQCSFFKPKLCLNGRLVDNAIICGCPDGFNQSGKACIPANPPASAPQQQPDFLPYALAIFAIAFIALLLAPKLLKKKAR